MEAFHSSKHWIGRTAATVAAVAICGGWLSGHAAVAMVNGYQPTPDDARFDAVGAFGFTVWLNGVSQQDNWWGGATLIAPDLVVTARHNLSSNPAAVDRWDLRRPLPPATRRHAPAQGGGERIPVPCAGAGVGRAPDRRHRTGHPANAGHAHPAHRR
jgi:hypothetical protein